MRYYFNMNTCIIINIFLIILYTGMSIDLENDIVYWVDDKKDTVEWIGIDGTGHGSFKMPEKEGQNPFATLFGVAVYEVGIIISSNFYCVIRQTILHTP